MHLPFIVKYLAVHSIHSGLSAIVGTERALNTIERAAREITLFKRRAQQLRDILKGAYFFNMRWDRPGRARGVVNAPGENFDAEIMGGIQAELSTDFDRGDGVSGYMVDGPTVPHALLALGKQMLDNTVEQPLPSEPASATPVYDPPVIDSRQAGCDHHGVWTDGCGACDVALADAGMADAAGRRWVDDDPVTADDLIDSMPMPPGTPHIKTILS